MRISDSIYPYPVLSIDDDDYIQNSEFDIEFTSIAATPFKNAVVKCRFILHDHNLERLISLGKAGLYLRVENSLTAYRKLYELEPGKYTFELEIDPKYMRKKVEVTGLLLAKQNITDFISDTINTDLYGKDYVFPDLNTGDPLAVAFTTNVVVNDEDSFKSVSSIMKVAKSKKEYMVVDPDGEIIYVYLPETLYEQYIRYQSVPDIALSIVILPALIQVLSYMVLNRGNDIDEQKWYMVIEKKIRSLDKDINDLFNEKISPLELAQMILENPVERSFNEIKGIVGIED